MTSSPSRIIIVGLGPGNPDLRTLGTQRALETADQIVLRTRIHPGLDDLASDPRVTDCDDLYDRADAFDSLYQTIARRVLEAAQSRGTVVFAVPGHPRFGERTVPLIEIEAGALEIPVDVLDAVSFVDASIGAVKTDPLAHGLQITDAEHLAATVDAEPFAAGRLGVDSTRPLLVAQLYGADLAAATKIALARLYPDDHPVILIQAAGASPGQAVQMLTLHVLDRQPVDHLCSLWVPPLAPLEAARSPDAVLRIVARLRASGGCPWDREQTHASLRDAVLAEAYEVVDAIDDEDDHALAEELGDLLLIITMHAQIAEEEGSFRIEDVFEGINRKLVRRHPHVFGSVTAHTPADVVTTWEGVKETERAEKGNARAVQNPVDRLPRSMPVTRKVIEILARRQTLESPVEAHAGDRLLAEVRSLIDQGLDPERSLETALRNVVSRTDGSNESLATAGSGTQQGRERT